MDVSQYQITGLDGAEERRRSADTAIFSRVLYHLSYLGMRETAVRWAKQGSNL
jgi:hypothetical protein